MDDFALRKRQRYGTVLIDLERRSPVALRPDRTAESLAQWLRAHPGGQVIARDRSTAYADGARHGAPAATQVADRFHLFQNLREALDQVFSTHSQALDAVNALVHQQPVPLADGALAVPVPCHDIALPAQQRAAQRQACRQALHTQVWTLHRQGWTAPAIAQHVGLSLRTVQRDLRTITFAGRKRRSDLGDSASTPLSRISSSAGMPGATPRCGCFATSASVAMQGAMEWSRPMHAVCARPRACPPGTAAHGSPCLPWPSRCASP